MLTDGPARILRDTVRASDGELGAMLGASTTYLARQCPEGYQLARITVRREHPSRGNRYFLRAEYHPEKRA